MAREKRVLPDGDIPHLWAHQRQDAARNSRDTFYFNGRTIYSYGQHFPIATIIHQSGDENVAPAYAGMGTVVLFTKSTYSNATTKHIRMVDNAIPSSFDVWHVNEFFSFPKTTDREAWEVSRRNEAHTKNMKAVVLGINNLCFDQKKARTANYWSEIMSNIAFLKKYVTTWKCMELLAEGDRWLTTDIEEKVLQETLLGAAAKRVQEEKQKKKEATQALKKKAQEWMEGVWDKDALSGTRWHDTEGILLRCETLYDGDEKPFKVFQTSKGIQVEYEEGLKFLRLCNIARAKKHSLPNGIKPSEMRVGNWQINRIDENGNVTAGCHKIKWEEIERVATLEGLLVSSGPLQEGGEM